MTRGEIQRGLNAHQHGASGDDPEQNLEPERPWQEGGSRVHTQRRIAETREPEHDRQPVQPGVVAADDQNELLQDAEGAGDRRNRLRSEKTERRNDLHEMAEGR